MTKFVASDSGYEVVGPDPAGTYRRAAQHVANEYRDDPNYAVTFNGELVQPEPLHKAAETSIAVSMDERSALARRQARRVKNAHCSFCGKGQEQVRKIVAGPGVHICDHCVALSACIIAEELEGRSPGRHAGPDRAILGDIALIDWRAAACRGCR